MKRNLISLLLFLALCVSLCVAQQATQQPTTQKPESEEVVRITTNLVQVDAVVTDKSGKVVTDLKPEEVQIFEDNRPQKITNFSYFVTGAATTEKPSAKPMANQAADKSVPPIPPTSLKPQDVRRTIAIIVDDLGMSFESTHFIRRALKKFVDEQMQPGDLVAIIRTGGGIGALQQFSSDKRQLYSAIERLKWNANGRSGINPFPSLEDNSGQREEAVAANEELNKFREDLL